MSAKKARILENFKNIAQRRCAAYYSKFAASPVDPVRNLWVQPFGEKTLQLVEVHTFPLDWKSIASPGARVERIRHGKVARRVFQRRLDPAGYKDL